MRYRDFENIITNARMNRYFMACGGNTRKAMTLYRKNLQLTQELFTIISCFEVALRNAIDIKLVNTLGNNWLSDAIEQGGVFDTPRCKISKESISESLRKLYVYSHSKLVAELGFGFWRYLFAQNQFNATGRVLLQVFPDKPTSTPTLQYNNTHIFNQLAMLNNLRNRMAHHEPICFLPGQPIKNSMYAQEHYNLILQLFLWMKIDEASLLYGLDHVKEICKEIDNL